MSETDRSANGELADTLFDSLAAMGKWLMLVVAIAAGTFLGLLLFGWFLLHQAEGKLKEVFGPSTSSETSTTAPAYTNP
jgi:hypothetical protein